MQTVEIKFDSHSKYKALLAKGFTEQQAEGIVEIFTEISLPNAATREDVANAKSEIKQEIADLRAEVKQEIGDLRSEVKQEIVRLETKMEKEIGNLRIEIKADRAELYKFMFVQALGIVGLTVALVKLLPQF